MTALFAGLILVLIAEALYEWYRILGGGKPAALRESPYVATRWAGERAVLSGDVAYERHLERTRPERPLSREELWLDELHRRYSGASRCC